MVKQISEMLGIQFIISTHIEGMIEKADTIHQFGEVKEYIEKKDDVYLLVPRQFITKQSTTEEDQ
jgi:hypothetical protein